MLYHLKNAFVIDEAANPRFGTPGAGEVKRAETDYFHGFNRIIGGDRGDLLFDGYEVVDGKTILSNPAVSTNLLFRGDRSAVLTQGDGTVEELAREIFDASFASIGIETVEHS